MQLQSLATSPRHYGVPQWSLVSDEQLGRRWWPSLPDDITKSLHTIRRSLTTTSHSLDDNGDAGPRRMASLRRRTRTGEKSPRLCGHPRLHSMTPTFGTRQRTSSPAHRGPLLWHRPRPRVHGGCVRSLPDSPLGYGDGGDGCWLRVGEERVVDINIYARNARHGSLPGDSSKIHDSWLRILLRYAMNSGGRELTGRPHQQ